MINIEDLGFNKIPDLKKPLKSKVTITLKNGARLNFYTSLTQIGFLKRYTKATRVVTFVEEDGGIVFVKKKDITAYVVSPVNQPA